MNFRDIDLSDIRDIRAERGPLTSRDRAIVVGAETDKPYSVPVSELRGSSRTTQQSTDVKSLLGSYYSKGEDVIFGKGTFRDNVIAYADGGGSAPSDTWAVDTLNVNQAFNFKGSSLFNANDKIEPSWIAGNVDSEWGSINGTLADQTDLQTALNSKLESSDLNGYATETWVNNKGYITDYTVTETDVTSHANALTWSNLGISKSDVSRSDVELGTTANPLFAGIKFGTNDGDGIVWSRNTDGASIKFYNTGDSDTNSRLEFQVNDNGTEYFRWTRVDGSTTHEDMLLKDGNLDVLGDVGAQGNLTAYSNGGGSPMQDTYSLTQLNVSGNIAFQGTNIFDMDGTIKDSFISGGTATSLEWGNITGTLSNQTDLQGALDGKSNTGHTHGYSDLPISSTQVSHWEAAYSWGNHADAGYMPKSGGTFTGQPTLEKGFKILKHEPDGNDLGSSFESLLGDLSPFHINSSNNGNYPFANGGGLHIDVDTARTFQIISGNGSLYHRLTAEYSNNSWGGWKKVWDDSNLNVTASHLESINQNLGTSDNPTFGIVELGNKEWDSSDVGGQTGAQLVYDASSGIAIHYGSSGGGVTKGLSAIIDVNGTSWGNNMSISGGTTANSNASVGLVDNPNFAGGTFNGLITNTQGGDTIQFNPVVNDGRDDSFMEWYTDTSDANNRTAYFGVSDNSFRLVLSGVTNNEFTVDGAQSVQDLFTAESGIESNGSITIDISSGVPINIEEGGAKRAYYDYNFADNKLQIGTVNSSGVVISRIAVLGEQDSTRVGINTNSPNQTLDVNGNMDINGTIDFASTGDIGSVNNINVSSFNSNNSDEPINFHQAITVDFDDGTPSSGYAIDIEEGGIDITGDSSINGDFTFDSIGHQMRFDHDGSRALWRVRYNGAGQFTYSGRNNNELHLENGSSNSIIRFQQDRIGIDVDVNMSGDLEWTNGEITSDDNNTGARIIARAINNPADGDAIFAVESSGGATRFGVTQDYGGWFRDNLQVGYTHDTGGLSNPDFMLDVNGDFNVEGISYADNHAESDSRIKTITGDYDPLEIADKAHLKTFYKRGWDNEQIGLIADNFDDVHDSLISWKEDEEFGEIRALNTYGLASTALAGVGKLHRKFITIDDKVESNKEKIQRLEKENEELKQELQQIKNNK